MTKLTALEKMIAGILVDSAIHRKGNLTYSEITDILWKNYGQKVNPHYGLSAPLGNIARLCYELGLPLLSVRVQYKNSTAEKAASGFYEIACELKPQYRQLKPEEVRNIELQLTRECTDWKRLMSCLEPGTQSAVSEHSIPTVQQQFDIYVSEMLKIHGQGYVVSTQDIVDALVRRYQTNPNSISPSDFCYNRWNRGISADDVCYFEYLEHEKYRILGKDYPFNGGIYTHPKHEAEYCAGFCVNGKRQLGKAPIYPDEVEPDSEEYREGKQKTVQINIHERNPAARLACIQKYGTTCCVCGFNFGKAYGPQCEGMIHIHHLKPVSETEQEYVVDPINDLRPVCPNCHMVIHSKPDCYTIEEVIAMRTRSLFGQEDRTPQQLDKTD